MPHRLLLASSMRTPKRRSVRRSDLRRIGGHGDVYFFSVVNYRALSHLRVEQWQHHDVDLRIHFENQPSVLKSLVLQIGIVNIDFISTKKIYYLNA